MEAPNVHPVPGEPDAVSPPSGDRIAALERQVQEHLDGWKRAKADYLNLKKQSEKDRQEMAQFAQAAAVMSFLPIYDHLVLAIRHIPDADQKTEWAKGLDHILKQFRDTLKTLNIEPIEAEGKPFDPNLHHAVAKAKSEAKPDTVIEVRKTGWKVGDRVLEPAQVVVAE